MRLRRRGGREVVTGGRRGQTRGRTGQAHDVEVVGVMVSEKAPRPEHWIWCSLFVWTNFHVTVGVPGVSLALNWGKDDGGGEGMMGGMRGRVWMVGGKGDRLVGMVREEE